MNELEPVHHGTCRNVYMHCGDCRVSEFNSIHSRHRQYSIFGAHDPLAIAPSRLHDILLPIRHIFSLQRHATFGTDMHESMWPRCCVRRSLPQDSPLAAPARYKRGMTCTEAMDTNSVEDAVLQLGRPAGHRPLTLEGEVGVTLLRGMAKQAEDIS